VLTVKAVWAFEFGMEVFVGASIFGCSSPNNVTSPIFFVCAESVRGSATSNASMIRDRFIM